MIALMAAILYDDTAAEGYTHARQWAINLAIDLYADAKAAVVVAESELRG